MSRSEVAEAIGREGAFALALLLALAFLWAFWSANRDYLTCWLRWRWHRPNPHRYEDWQRFRRDLAIWLERKPRKP